MANCPQLRFTGLMAMGKIGDREGFQKVKIIRDQMLQSGCGLTEDEFVISMGTS